MKYPTERHEFSSLKGQFIIAMPNLADPNFYQTVVCICEHTAQGAVGIVTNRIHPFLTGKDIFEGIQIECTVGLATRQIHSGGPVHHFEIFILHTEPFGWDGCLMVTPSLAMSNSRDIITEIAQGGGPDSYIISLGCAGWGPGQLDAEIKENVWLTSAVWESLIFDFQVEDQWNAAIKKLGIDPLLISATAGHA